MYNLYTIQCTACHYSNWEVTLDTTTPGFATILGQNEEIIITIFKAEEISVDTHKS